MKKIPILRYNDLRDLMCLTHEHHLNGVVVDDAALEVMLRIENLIFVVILLPLRRSDSHQMPLVLLSDFYMQ